MRSRHGLITTLAQKLGPEAPVRYALEGAFCHVHNQTHVSVQAQLPQHDLELVLIAGEKAVRSQHGLITTLAHKLGPEAPVQYALEGAIAVGGAGVSWLRDNLGLIQSAAEVEALAGSVSSTEGKPRQRALPVLQTVCCAGMSWLRDNLGLIQSAAEVEERAGSVSSTEGAVFAL